MDNLHEVACYVFDQCVKAGYVMMGVRPSEGSACLTNGRSYYVYANAFGNSLKFRISNHSCGEYRAHTEICFSDMLHAELHFEKHLFETISMGEIFHTDFYESKICPTNQNEQVVSERISKAGNLIYRIERTHYRTLIQKIKHEK